MSGGVYAQAGGAGGGAGGSAGGAGGVAIAAVDLQEAPEGEQRGRNGNAESVYLQRHGNELSRQKCNRRRNGYGDRIDPEQDE